MLINNRVTTSNYNGRLIRGLQFQPQTSRVTRVRVTETLCETKILVESSGTIQTQSGNLLAAATLSVRRPLRQSDRHRTAPLSIVYTDTNITLNIPFLPSLYHAGFLGFCDDDINVIYDNER